MLWAYDETIVDDLKQCIDPKGGMNNTIKVIGDEGVMGIFAQLKEDKINFPAIFLDRSSDTPLDSKRYNFTRMHKGVPSVLDPETNNLYLEKCVPIELKYSLHVLATNTTDMDEVIRELLFRYSSVYFLSFEVPYESKRKINFGISINPNTNISRKSGTVDYLKSGQLYESILELECQGAVLLSYTPRHLQRAVIDSIKLK